VPTSRVRSLTPALVKGLEFDLVVLVDPEEPGRSVEGTVDRYVSMTRATRQLVILLPWTGALVSPPLPLSQWTIGLAAAAASAAAASGVAALA
jgi:hypothetical protein